VLLAAPVDFISAGLLVPWTSERSFDPNQVIKTFGNVPAERVGRLLGIGSSTLQSIVDRAGLQGSTIRGKFTETFLAVSRWVDDGAPFAGAAFRQWIEDFYQHNKLARGELQLRGLRVDLSNVEVSLLNIAGSKDQICPLPQAEATMGLVSDLDTEFVVLDAGHVGLMAGPAAREELWLRTREWLEPRSRR
jgi:polyhydroxyalkanoate synthase subunit PhaC